MSVEVTDAPTGDVPFSVDRISRGRQINSLHQLDHVATILNRRYEETLNRSLRQLCGPRNMRSYDFGRVGNVVFSERTTTNIPFLLCGSMKQQQGDHDDHEVNTFWRNLKFVGESHLASQLRSCEFV